MLKLEQIVFKNKCVDFCTNTWSIKKLRCFSDNVCIPDSADVIVIGGGSAGCHALYHLAKRGIKALLIERAQLTAGTTWHTAGLVWRLRPNDVDIQLLTNSIKLLKDLKKETGLDPGWIQNGGIFIAHSKVRLDEYKRLATVGNVLNIENYILNPSETKNVFPLLNEKSFIASLYSPGDGVVDPAMLCAALRKSAILNGANIIENCPVTDLMISTDIYGDKNIFGVKTIWGDIKTKIIINATGVWGCELVKKYGSKLPLMPMKHGYIVTETISGVRGLPNVRDHDFSIYFRIQGDSICMGGYESNPILIDRIPDDFNFSLYDLDWSIFKKHIQKSINLCPTFKNCGIKATVCGPEAFTPDHKPLMGPDDNIKGLYHSCGYNSAGMMFGGGCGEQIALWAIHGEPELPMFQFDIRRFSKKQVSSKTWIRERSHESYVKNYGLVFLHDQPLAGRNLILDPLHSDMLNYNAFMEEKQGWERPAFFLESKVEISPYSLHEDDETGFQSSCYINYLKGDLKYEFSDHHSIIRNEVLTCRTNAVVFNMSYFGKFYLDGPDADRAVEWLFTCDRNIMNNNSKVVYTCALNNAGGVEADLTISKICYDINYRRLLNCYYIVTGGASSFYLYNFLKSEIKKRKFKASIKNITENFGIISVQGPTSRDIVQKITNIDLSEEAMPPNSGVLANIVHGKHKCSVKILRVSFVGELGYEIHVDKNNCSLVYNLLMSNGKPGHIINAGYRALYSLSSEKGYHLWGYDLRSNDTPVEANLLFLCKNPFTYRGKTIIERQRQHGFKKKLVYLTLKDQVPLWGLEGVYRNGEAITFIRRGEYAYTLRRPLGQAYIERKDGNIIDEQYITSGKYHVNVMGKMFPAECHLKSPFNLKSKIINM